jgi:hypothetical protein
MRGHDSKPIAALALVLAICGTLGMGALARGASVRASPGFASATAQAPLGGVNIGLANGVPLSTIDREIAFARRLHAKLVRVEIQWSAFAPGGPGSIDARAQRDADRLMADASAAGIRVIAFVDRTPCWASSGARGPLPPFGSRRAGPANAWPPREASAFGAFTGWLAKRYGGALAAIEVWNEPDQANQAYLAGPSKPKRYAELLRAAYPQIKHGNANVQVLGGSLVGSNGAFMKALYRNGVKGYYDGVAVHFYNLVLGSLRAFREVQLQNRDDKPLWLDEFGWSSCLPAHRIQQEQACVTRKAQARNVADVFRELARTPYVAAETVFKLQDAHGEDFGVVSERGSPKLSFGALSKVLSSPFGAPSPVTLRLRVRRGRVIASGSGPVGDYMKLEAFAHRTLRYRALFTLDRFDRYSIVLPAALGTRGLTVRVYQYWLGVGRDAQASV